MTDMTADAGTSGLTAAEHAYFDSRGIKTDGLDPGEAGAAVASSAGDAPAAKAPDEPAARPAPATKSGVKASDLDPDEEPIGEDGRLKNPGRFIC